MPLRRSGAGDPVRTLELLWRAPDARPRRGPRPGLDLEVVVRTATEIADTEGLDTVTMRAVAGALGVSPMTLYTYLPGKAELLDLMLDAAYLRMTRTSTAGRPWRARLAAVAGENRELFARHPWASEVTTTRPPLGPGQLAKYEHELAAFDGLGLDDVAMDSALGYLLGFVQAWARAAAEVRAERPAGAPDDQRWWEKAGPLLETLVDADRYPLATRVGSAAGAAYGGAFDPAHAYEFGLARVLDGLATLIEPQADQSQPAQPGRTRPVS